MSTESAIAGAFRTFLGGHFLTYFANKILHVFLSFMVQATCPVYYNIHLATLKLLRDSIVAPGHFSE
jgi:hypothetical protein